MKIKNFPIIINPASGKPQPVLSILNEVFRDSGINWEVLIAKKAGESIRYAKDLLEKGPDAIGVFGGDGTVMEVMSAMIGSAVPLVILPGGTANVLATDLGIPMDLKEACLLVRKGAYKALAVDVGQFNRRYFILRACLGFEAEMVKGADRKTKNRFGRLAYLISAFNALGKMKVTEYEVTVDGEKHSVSGVTCIIANSGNAGSADLKLAKKIEVSDGKLDVLVIKKFDLSLLQYAVRVFTKGDGAQDRELVGHWQGTDIKVTSKPLQDVVLDGEVLAKMAIHAKIIPQAVTILVPKTRGRQAPD